MKIHFWDKGEKRYWKKLFNKVQQEIYQERFNIAIVENLVKGFSVERLKHLKDKEAKWTAKREFDKKKVYDALKELKSNITKEENMIKGADLRNEQSMEGIRVRNGKLKFIKELLDGKYSIDIPYEE